LGAIVVVDLEKEHSAVLEAAAVKLPIVGLVDTNVDPSLIDYVIPANDDSPQSIEMIFSVLKESVLSGLILAEKTKVEKKQATMEKRASVEKEGVEVVASLDESAVSSTFDSAETGEEAKDTPKRSPRPARSSATRPAAATVRKNTADGGGRISAASRTKKQG